MSTLSLPVANVYHVIMSTYSSLATDRDPIVTMRSNLAQASLVVQHTETALHEAQIEAARLQHEVLLSKQLLRRLVIEAIAAGLTEVETAQCAGVSRHTVRDWLGKRKRRA